MRKLTFPKVLAGIALALVIVGVFPFVTGLHQAGRRQEDPIKVFDNPYAGVEVKYGHPQLTMLAASQAVLHAEVVSPADGLSLVEARVGGTVERVMVDIGTEVKSGQPLVVLLSPDGLTERNKVEVFTEETRTALAIYDRKNRAEACVKGLGKKLMPDGKALSLASKELLENLEDFENAFVAEESLSAYRVDIFKPLYDYRRLVKLLRMHEKLLEQKAIAAATVNSTRNQMIQARLLANSALDNGLKKAREEAEQARLKAVQAQVTEKTARERVYLLGGSTEPDAPADQFTLRAPMDGWISERIVTRGGVVNAGDHLVTIVDPKQLRVQVMIPRHVEEKFRRQGRLAESELSIYFLERGWQTMTPEQANRKIPDLREESRRLPLLTISRELDIQSQRRSLLTDGSRLVPQVGSAPLSPKERVSVLLETSHSAELLLVPGEAIATNSAGKKILYLKPSAEIAKQLPLPPSRERVENPFPSIEVNVLSESSAPTGMLAVEPKDRNALTPTTEVIVTGAQAIADIETLDIANQRDTGSHSH